MPFKKVLKEGEKSPDFTGINILKNLWRARADDVTANPRQRQTATLILSVLNATDPLMKKVLLLELITEYATRVGYKVPSDINFLDPSLKPVEDIADGVLKYLTGGLT